MTLARGTDEIPPFDKVSRVLVIDDNDDGCLLLANALRERGWTVDTARTVREGLELAAAHRHDVVLSELILPDTRGFFFVSALRGVLAQGAAIIAVTRVPEAQLHVRALAAGFDHVHAKPIDVEQLHAQLSRVRDGRLGALR